MKRPFFLLLLIAMVSSSLPCPAQETRSIMQSEAPRQKLELHLVSAEDWHPYPRFEERNAWEALTDSTRATLVKTGEQYLQYEWPDLPATLFLDFERTGNRSRYQRPRLQRRRALAYLVLAECVEDKGRFLDDIMNGIWTISEETYWGVPAHLNIQKAGYGLPDVDEPTMDLFAGETGALLAWTHYLLGDQLEQISPLIPKRIESEIDRRILTPNLLRDDYWWMNLTDKSVINNWNPWCNSNWLTCVLILETDQTRRLDSIEKILLSLDQFIDSYPEDGACDEGPGYWRRAAASMYDVLDLMATATQGEVNVYDVPLIQKMGSYIYRTHIAGDYFINFSDASAIVRMTGDLSYRYGRDIGDPRLQAFGAYMAQRHPNRLFETRPSLLRLLPALFHRKEVLSAEAHAPLTRDVWLSDSEVMAARDEQGSAKGLYLAAKGSHNAVSHNHNDVGNFIVYHDGQPLIIDVGVETYTKKTFSPQRYEIWTMQSAYHNLPLVNGVMQENGREFAARSVTYSNSKNVAELTMDISGAYPETAGIESWNRTMRLNRGKSIDITDDFILESESSDVTLTIMTHKPVQKRDEGELILRAGSHKEPVHLLFDPLQLEVDIEPIAITDSHLQSVWDDQIFRIQFHLKQPVKHETITMTIVPGSKR